MSASGKRYIHSFDPAEQARLIHQGRFLEPYIQPHVDFSGCASVLEVGCGVGAQLQVLLERFPQARFTGIDHSAVQLATARSFLREALASGRVQLVEGSAFRLPFPDGTFDGACIYFVLEHLADHLGVLGEVYRVLKPGGVLFCTEVFNSGLYARPMLPTLAAYWRAFNALQAELGGDPDAGVRLAALFEATGFARVTVHDASAQMDSRLKGLAERRGFLDFWQTLLLSGAPQLVQHGRITSRDIDALKADFAALAGNPDAIFRYAAFQACGYKPTTTGSTHS
jgi:SAM-dependent methyltransferase